ncbi:MAG: DsbA family oxidoreductase [Actinomycetota bacterium]|nr:DsbA family oxidoreductase [Actinomycetota bacterium]
MKVEIFADVACPFCFIGKRNFEQALAGFQDEPVEVVWRSFQLNPDMPAEVEGDMHDYLADKFGITRDEAIAMNEKVIASARSAGAEIDFSRARPRNTFDALRMLQLGMETGHGDAMAEQLFSAYFTGSADIGDPGELTKLAVAAGIDPGEAETVARGDRFADRVREDCAEASSLGLSGVPAFIIDRSLLVSGAQPPEVMRGALDQAAAASSTA